MKDKLVLRMITIFLAVGFLLGMFIGFSVNGGRTIDTQIKTDTIVKMDTVYIDTPVVKDSIVLKYVTRYVQKAPGNYDIPNDTMLIADDMPPDSVEVVLPITQKVYEGEQYKAYVSGYEPNLDSINIYNKTEYITNTIVKKQKRWGVVAGVGVGGNWKNVAPYVGVMFGYKIF